MEEFIVGQRWVSHAEPDLGLGTVAGTAHRTVTLVFSACGETRTYAREGAPLSRVMFAPGDCVLDSDERGMEVESVTADNGLLSYHGRDAQGQARHIEETGLYAGMQLNRPAERLFSHQFDSTRLFELRHTTWQHRHQLEQSTLYGLTGCRTNLIPHQLYIAHEVAGRHAPRVLLADEVGLGKTIEAGLVLHQQLLSERARRVLILVPDSLVHQWLVEMLRRFNLLFSIFDADRCATAQPGDPHDNPFQDEQLVLCSLDLLAAAPDYQRSLLAGDWDLMVVDEAHHLEWSPDHASPAYRLVEQLAAVVPGVLLLTATPEQLGRAAHFARLRLLDPHRFPDLDSFVREEAGYAPVAQAVESLLADRPLAAARLAALQQMLRDPDSERLLDSLQASRADSERHRALRLALIERLLDRHGTGRILFRNTRSAVKGFAARRLNAVPLSPPPAYAQCLAQQSTQADISLLATPERIYAAHTGAPAWTHIDPRVAWLADTLRRLKPDKVLVIAAQAQSVVELAEALYSGYGVHAAVFHEHLSLVERDRAAAFFADRESGTQVLVCSEVGSEGRNFQFSRHLVLFDLPANPDLLEQRIGRLDRIGQTQTVQIHLPWLEDTAQAVLYRWYHEALDAFRHTCPAGTQVYQQLEGDLLALCRQPGADATRLVDTARDLLAGFNRALQQGRDRLLEYNSCRQPAADRLCEQAMRMENPDELRDYTESLLDAFGVDTRLHSDACLIVTPGEHLLHPLPGLPDDGLTVTCDRDVALAFEDAHYLSWEHPLLRGAMDMLLTSEMGNCSLCAVQYPRVTPGTLLLECLYVIEAGHRELVRRWHLAPLLIRVVVDEQGRRHDDGLSVEWIATHGTPVDSRSARQIVQARDRVLRGLLRGCSALAAEAAPQRVAAAGEQRRTSLHSEIERLRALARINPAVRPEEITFLEGQLQLLEQILQSVSPRLDAVRVMVST